MRNGIGLDIDPDSRKVYIEVPIKGTLGVHYLDIESKEGRAYLVKASKRHRTAFVLTEDGVSREVKIDQSLNYEKLAKELKKRGWTNGH